MSAGAPAGLYSDAPDLWLVTTYFNPVGYRSRLDNYRRFRDRMRRSGLPLLTIECTFGDQPSVLSGERDVVVVRARDVLWQKERLLNIAIARLPTPCTKVAWVDADVWFTNPRWATETARLLDQYPLVQPFDTLVRLPPDTGEDPGALDRVPGFAALHAADPELAARRLWRWHGVTGGAWAARREIAERHGLYDACIVGGGDHVACHAMCGDWASPCLNLVLGVGTRLREHYWRWAEAFHRDVDGRIGHVAGELVHLWHGTKENRRYARRHERLHLLAYDPDRDVRVAADGCWEWATDNPALHRAVADYFRERREDGGLATGAPQVESTASADDASDRSQSSSLRS